MPAVDFFDVAPLQNLENMILQTVGLAFLCHSICCHSVEFHVAQLDLYSKSWFKRSKSSRSLCTYYIYIYTYHYASHDFLFSRSTTLFAMGSSA